MVITAFLRYLLALSFSISVFLPYIIQSAHKIKKESAIGCRFLFIHNYVKYDLQNYGFSIGSDKVSIGRGSIFTVSASGREYKRTSAGGAPKICVAAAA